MDPLHSSDSISFSPDFVEPRRFHLMADPSNSQVRCSGAFTLHIFSPNCTRRNRLSTPPVYSLVNYLPCLTLPIIASAVSHRYHAYDLILNSEAVQPSMYALMSCQRAAFRASDAVVNRIGRFYGCNRARPLSERQRYDQVNISTTNPRYG